MVFVYIGDFMFKFFILLLLMTNIAAAKNERIFLTEENSVAFNQPVSSDYTSKKILEIMLKSSKASPIFLVLNTPGGSVPAGLSFIDTVKALNIPVHTVTLFAASMGYQMVQELGTRYITPSGTLMSHRGSVSGLSGQVPGELNSRVLHISSVLDGMMERASKRVGISKQDYSDMIIPEFWTFGENAVNLNHADKVADVVCESKLIRETYEENVFTLFGSVTVKFSKCPLITEPLSISFGGQVSEKKATKIKQELMQRRRNTNLTF